MPSCSARPLRDRFFQDVLILTGGSRHRQDLTTLNGIITLLEQRGFKVALAPLTYWAAKRMSEVTYWDKTIHRLLEVDFQDERAEKINLRQPEEPSPLTQWWWMRCPWWTSSCLNR